MKYKDKHSLKISSEYSNSRDFDRSLRSERRIVQKLRNKFDAKINKFVEMDWWNSLTFDQKDLIYVRIDRRNRRVQRREG